MKVKKFINVTFSIVLDILYLIYNENLLQKILTKIGKTICPVQFPKCNEFQL